MTGVDAPGLTVGRYPRSTSGRCSLTISRASRSSSRASSRSSSSLSTSRVCCPMSGELPLIPPGVRESLTGVFGSGIVPIV